MELSELVKIHARFFFFDIAAAYIPKMTFDYKVLLEIILRSKLIIGVW